MSKPAPAVELEYPMIINGQEVMVKRYDNPELRARLSDHSSLSFHRKARMNGRKWEGDRRWLRKRAS